jgi:hypothetical protein
MRIDAADDGEQRRAFDQRIRRRLAEQGALAGVTEGEAFKALRDL